MSKTILVAEDDKFLSDIYKTKFTEKGFIFAAAFDGEQALDLIRESPPDAILLDLLMPKKDGFQVLSELKNNPQWKNIPVIVASNLGQDGDIKRAMSLGADDYFIKSNVKISDVVDKITGLNI